MATIIDLSSRPRRPLHLTQDDSQWVWDNVVVNTFWSLYQHGVAWVKDPNESIFLTHHDYHEVSIYWWADSEKESLSIQTAAVDVSDSEIEETLKFIRFTESLHYRVEVEQVVSPTTGCKGWKIKVAK